MRRSAVKHAHNGQYQGIDVKSGLGGLRDIEFLVQGLQLIHAPQRPALLEGNTLTALDLVQDSGILPEGVVSDLREDYLLLRRIEHCLQIMEDLQIHSLPTEKDKLDALAKRVLGHNADGKEFANLLEDHLARTHGFYRKYLIEGPD
jgi:glutamate-ammonia-ligase adenylyltransferase